MVVPALAGGISLRQVRNEGFIGATYETGFHTPRMTPFRSHALRGNEVDVIGAADGAGGVGGVPPLSPSLHAPYETGGFIGDISFSKSRIGRI